MRNGIHTIRSGFTAQHSPTAPRRYSLDNGDFEKNMVIESVELIFAENQNVGGNQDRVSANAVYFTIATSELGATPTSSTTSPEEYGSQFALRLSDSRQVCWGVMQGSGGLFQPQIILDSDVIIPGDIYVNAWSTGSGGSIDILANSIGFIIKMRQVKNTGNQALLYQVRETDLE